MKNDYDVIAFEDIAKVCNLVMQKKSFKVVGFKAGDMGKVVKNVESAIEELGLKVRVYTHGRHIAAAATGPLGVAALAVHNLATINPDYEIAKCLSTNELIIEFVGDETLSDMVSSEIDGTKKIAVSAWDKIKNSALGNVTANIGDSISVTMKDIFSKENIGKAKDAIDQVAADSWAMAKEKPQQIKDKFDNMDKGYKILVLTSIAGGAVIALPFAVAAASGVSIVSALAAIGGGALAAGGWGVAGGIVVTAGGTALSASVAATLAHKFIKDPEVEALVDNFSKLEELVKKYYVDMEKDQQKYKIIYEKFVKITEYMATLQEQINNGEKYDIKQVRNFAIRSETLIEDFKATFAEK